mgnify:CR=1 FL=1
MRKLFCLAILLLLQAFSYAQQNDFNNRFLLGQSFEQAGDYERALTVYEELYKQQPNNQVILQGLNRAYVNLKEYAKSVSLLEKAIKAYPGDVTLYGLLGSSYYLEGKEELAFSTWDNGTKIQPGNETLYRMMANFALERRAFEKAIDLLKKGKAVSKDPKSFGYDLASLYSVNMNYTEAAEEYAQIVINYPDQYPYVEQKVFAFTNKPEALDVTIKIFEKYKNKADISFNNLLGLLFIEKKEYDKAFDYYLYLDKKQNRQGAELFNFGQRVLGEGSYEAAVKAFEYIINNYPASSFFSSSKLAYAKCLETIYERNAADSVYDWMPYALPKEGNEEKYKKIFSIYDEVIKLYPFTEVSVEAHYRKGVIYYNSLNNVKKAKECFDYILKDFPLSNFFIPSADAMADIYLNEGNIVTSTECLDRIISHNRSTAEQRNAAKLKKAKLLFYKGNFETAQVQLAEILTDLKDNSANDALELSLLISTTSEDSLGLANFAEARMLADRNILNEAAEKFHRIAQKKENFVLSNMAEIEQAEILLAAGKYNNAVELLNNISAENEKNIYSDKALYLKAKTFQYLLKDMPKAIDNYEELLAKYPSSMYLEESRNEITKLRNKSS